MYKLSTAEQHMLQLLHIQPMFIIFNQYLMPLLQEAWSQSIDFF